MTGKKIHPVLTNDFKDPFDVGQMVGLIVALTFIENNGGIKKDFLRHVKFTAAEKVQDFFDKPTEDIFLMIDDLVKQVEEV